MPGFPEHSKLSDSPMISVIVPVYRVEPYLARCLDSIINQSYRHLEIILVDDGSPDNCGAICDDYASRDARIRVIHQKNGGPSAARNAGLDIVTGDYIVFIDSDDYIAAGMMEGLVNEIQKESSDIVIFDYFVEKKDEVYSVKTIDSIKSLEKMQEMILMDSYTSFVWNKIYRASLFDNVRMCLRKFEDLMVMPHLFLKARKIIYLPVPYYYYNHANDTALTSTVNAANNKLNAISKYGLFRAWAEHEKLGRQFFKSVVDHSEKRAVSSAIGGLVASVYRPALSGDEISEIRTYLDSKRHDSTLGISKKHKILWWMVEHSRLLCWIYGAVDFNFYKLKVQLKFVK